MSEVDPAFGGTPVDVDPAFGGEPVDPSLSDRLLGGAEAALTIGTSAIAGPVSGLHGLAKTATSGLDAGVDAINQTRENLTYRPRTEEGRKILDSSEAALTIGSSAIAEPVSGVHGLVRTATHGLDAGVDAINQTRQNLTYRPRTEEGRKILESLSDLFEPVTETFETAEKFMGIQSEPHGPEVAALMHTAPVAATLGMGSIPRAVSKVPRTASRTPEQASSDAILNDVKSGSTPALVDDVNPDVVALRSAERLEIDVGPESVSQNPSFIEVTQALKSQPGSKLAAQEIEAIEQLGLRAEKLVDDLGGSTDRTVFDSSLKGEMTATIESLQSRSNKLYATVNEAVPARTRVTPSKSQKYLEEKLADLGGDESLLTPAEAQLKKITSGEVTYAALDRLRKDVGRGFNQKQGPFADEDVGILRQVYHTLLDDQQSVADSLHVGHVFRAARGLVGERKRIEDAAIALFGRELNNSLVPKLRTTANQLAKGDVTNLRKIMDSVPENRRQDAAVAILDHIFTSGSRTGDKLGSGFSTAYRGLQRSEGAVDALFEYLPKEARQRFDDIGRVANAVYRAKSRENTSRTARDILVALDDISTIRKLYESGKKIAAAEAGTTSIGAPGVGAAGVIGGILARRKTPRSEAADALLSSPEFRAAINRELNDIDRANRLVMRSQSFKNFIVTLDAKDASHLMGVGFFGWLMGEENGVE